MTTTLPLNPVKIFERLTLVAPLGLAFHDTATGVRVGSGLSVTVFQKSIPAARAQAFPNSSGVYVLHRAPGLGPEFGFGAGDESFWSGQPAPRDYVVEVSDADGRFLPFSFEVGLPPPARGLYEWVSPVESVAAAAPASPPEAEPPKTVPLYSAPARRVPPGFAAVRAELLDAGTGAPAAHAVVEARASGELAARGISDARGRLALLFPYPATQTPPADAAAESPPPQARALPLLEQTWDLEVSAAYAGGAALSAGQEFPDLRLALAQLNAPRARLWADREGGTELSVVTIKFGIESVLRSQDPVSLSPPARQPALLITPAGSPP